MNTERLKYLYQQYQLGMLTRTEIQEWESAISDLSMDEVLLMLIDQDWGRIDLKSPEVTNEEKETIYNYIVSQHQYRTAKYRLWQRIVTIAAAVAFIVYGIYFFNYSNNSKTAIQTAKLVNDIKPGHSAATLTLANGKKIFLSDATKGELVKEAGVSITKTTEGQVVYNITGSGNAESNKMNSLSTAKSETYILVLPDKSKVWLNAASTITYPVNFKTLKERRIQLKGEAYFEVTKDKDHPFIVTTDKQEVKVLGTHFNINSYSDEPSTITTLLQGSVNVTPSRRGNSKQSPSSGKILNPGEQSVLTINNEIQIVQANIEEAIAWKNGDFIFYEENLPTIMRKIARWYNVEVVYEGTFDKLRMNGMISRSRNVSAVLKMMANTGKVNFKIEGKKIIVSK